MSLSHIPWTERELRKQIVKACSALARKNLVAATDGNVSARLSCDRVLVTPSGVNKGDVGELDILLCDMDGRKIRGRGESSSEVHVHLAAYRNRDDIHAVVHAHPPVASAFTFAGMAGLLREPIVPEVVAQIGPIPCAPYIQPGTRELAEAVGKLFRECDVVLMAQHGAAAVGKDPWGAFLRMDKLEHCATIVKYARELAASAGTQVRTLSDEQIDALRAGYGKGKLKPRNPAAGSATAAAASDGGDAIVEKIAAEVLARLAAQQ